MIPIPPDYDSDEVTFQGKITSSEDTNNDAVEAMLNATQEGQKLNIIWNHYGPKNHVFKVTGIKSKRHTGRSEVVVGR